VGPLRENLKPLVDDARRIGWDRHHVHGLVEARVGVDVRTVTHPHRLEVARDLISGEPLRASECHVLDHVGQAPLILVFENRPRVHHEPQLSALLRLAILANVVGHAVRHHAHGDRRIERQRSIDGLSGSRLRLCEGRLRGEEACQWGYCQP
jgi:hypothetical protein